MPSSSRPFLERPSFGRPFPLSPFPCGSSSESPSLGRPFLSRPHHGGSLSHCAASCSPFPSRPFSCWPTCSHFVRMPFFHTPSFSWAYQGRPGPGSTLSFRPCFQGVASGRRFLGRPTCSWPICRRCPGCSSRAGRAALSGPAQCHPPAGPTGSGRSGCQAGVCWEPGTLLSPCKGTLFYLDCCAFIKKIGTRISSDILLSWSSSTSAAGSQTVMSLREPCRFLGISEQVLGDMGGFYNEINSSANWQNLSSYHSFVYIPYY